MIKEKSAHRITQLFRKKNEDSKIMSLFLTAGYPDLESTVDLILGFEQNGTDMIELGMPFSDPLADGPTIQYSSNKAIESGITMDGIFEMVRGVRKQSEIPIILMGYVNPVMRYGVEDFCKEASDAGVDGLIIPDLPVEESGILEEKADHYELPIIYLVAPNTSDERMRLIDEKSEGFVYCVSVTGVTGARDGEEVSKSVARFIERVKQNITKNSTMVGFGIKSHEDAEKIARDMDGFIVGSALIETIRSNYPDEGWMDEVFAFVRGLKYGNN
ncbi:tryptophan synthase subunit alpha [Balneolaceae bacterium YR4-1]|uniref:Tryptophan synthase alpha chain n=1 Tax=Halalkalibaculum roseum TaxID=2709311 RepID=A0A6M1SVT6_9BACT|nr:tryptophan synthase subunit alpha [Halalkalibaculum roseum]NGP76238.1 tryptophan synthase subunit alpha [Halalkalibaculum roseum]